MQGTINQSQVTFVHTNDPWNRCAERLYPFSLYSWSGEQDTLNVPVSRKPDCPLPALLTDQNQKLCTTCSHQRECYEKPDPRNQAKIIQVEFHCFQFIEKIKNVGGSYFVSVIFSSIIPFVSIQKQTADFDVLETV